MGKIVDADLLIAVARNIAAMSTASEEQTTQFEDMFRFMVNLTPEAVSKDKEDTRPTGEWGDIVKIGASIAYPCRKCGKSVVQPLTKKTYRFCPHCGLENGEKEVD